MVQFFCCMIDRVAPGPYTCIPEKMTGGKAGITRLVLCIIMLDITSIRTRLSGHGHKYINVMALVNHIETLELFNMLVDVNVKEIDYFNIGYNNLTNDLMTCISRILPTTTINILNMAANNICSYQLSRIDGVMIGQHIKVLFIDDNDLSGGFIQTLCDTIDKSSILEELYIRNTNINKADIMSLSTMITNDTNLKTLDLSRNKIGKYLRHLSDGVSLARTLNCLVLENTNITCSDINYLFDRLANSLSVLKILNLNDNNLHSDSAVHIAESLSGKEYNLVELHIGGHMLKKRDIDILRHAILEYPYFTIYLYNNSQTDIINVL